MVARDDRHLIRTEREGIDRAAREGELRFERQVGEVARDDDVIRPDLVEVVDERLEQLYGVAVPPFE